MGAPWRLFDAALASVGGNAMTSSASRISVAALTGPCDPREVVGTGGCGGDTLALVGCRTGDMSHLDASVCSIRIFAEWLEDCFGAVTAFLEDESAVERECGDDGDDGIVSSAVVQVLLCDDGRALCAEGVMRRSVIYVSPRHNPPAAEFFAGNDGTCCCGRKYVFGASSRRASSAWDKGGSCTRHVLILKKRPVRGQALISVTN